MAILTLLAVAPAVWAVEIDLPFSDHMVLQAGVEHPLWGDGTPGETVTVVFGGQTVRTVVDDDGRWSIRLAPLKTQSVPARLDATGTRSGRAVLEDLLVGEVWLCAGQSNMAFALESATNGSDGIDEAECLSTLRLCHRLPRYPGEPNPWSPEQVASIAPGTFFDKPFWQRAARATVADFSAVGFFFGRYLAFELDRPVGLIDVAVGGTPTEAWIPRDRILAQPALAGLDRDFPFSSLAHSFVVKRAQVHLRSWVESGREPPLPEHFFRPGFMHAAAIEPLRGLPIAGVLWYQGESNAHDADQHDLLFPLLVASLRETVGSADLPVIEVQLPGLDREEWPAFRESQAAALGLQGVEMVTTLDVGNPTDVHPRRKRPVGERLARVALETVYERDLFGRPPMLDGTASLDGSSIEVTIAHVGSGLRLVGQNPARALWVAGSDRIFERATSLDIVGDRLRVGCGSIDEPVAVRYAWEADPQRALCRIDDDMPVAPFRTDDWEPSRISFAGESAAPGQDIVEGTEREDPSPARSDSFENHALGTIKKPLVCDLGTWRSNAQAEISNHRAKTGRQALRIFGGRNQQIELKLNKKHNSGLVTFWAERWTRRNPFEFTVLARTHGTWTEVYTDGGTAITIGGYKARVEFLVEKRFDALRLCCTAPEGGGILIDDFELEPPRPMRVVSVTAEQPTLPVLFGNRLNPIARVRIDTEGSIDPIVLKTIEFTLASSAALGDVAGATVFGTGSVTLPHGTPDACFADEDRFGRRHRPAARLYFEGRRVLEGGANFFWLSVELTDAVDIDGSIDACCAQVGFEGGKNITPAVIKPRGPQRFGLSVRNAGDDGVAVFRIPGITATRRGTLIAVYDIRHKGWGDLPGDIDVGMSRSTDGGRTWEPMKTILDMGDDPTWRSDGVGDPCILHDDKTGTVWVAATWSHGDRSWRGSGPGLKPEETGQLVLTRSDDDGRTWSDPINITEQVKHPAWCFVLASPGRGITMADGTLVFPAQYQDVPEANRMPYSTIIFSRDRGETWRIATGVKPNTTECRVVELEAGTLMINMRDNRGGSRAVYVTGDMGETWRVHPTSRGVLPEPVCNAGLLRIKPGTERRKPWLAFVNPAVGRAPRRQMTIKLSVDGGMTWPTARQIVLDGGQSAGYSSLTMVDDETIGVFYECSRAHMAFQRIKVDDFFALDIK